jgi:hypothetical protein
MRVQSARSAARVDRLNDGILGCSELNYQYCGLRQVLLIAPLTVPLTMGRRRARLRLRIRFRFGPLFSGVAGVSERRSLQPPFVTPKTERKSNACRSARRVRRDRARRAGRRVPAIQLRRSFALLRALID